MIFDENEAKSLVIFYIGLVIFTVFFTIGLT